MVCPVVNDTRLHQKGTSLDILTSEEQRRVTAGKITGDFPKPLSVEIRLYLYSMFTFSPP